MNNELMSKKWVDQEGNPARIINTTAEGEYPIVALVKRGDHERALLLTQNLQVNIDSGPYLTEVNPYDDLEIDQPVIVWNQHKCKRRRHFAGVSSDGLPLAWENGYTSFLTRSRIEWDHCRAATEEEITSRLIDIENSDE